MRSVYIDFVVSGKSESAEYDPLTCQTIPSSPGAKVLHIDFDYRMGGKDDKSRVKEIEPGSSPESYVIRIFCL